MIQFMRRIAPRGSIVSDATGVGGWNGIMDCIAFEPAA
jgi:hypothetical protein